MDQRVLACTPCHGKEGRATSDGFYPRIAGKPAGYLYNQLLNFRDGRRNFPMMTYLTERQREDYLREIATWFANQRLPYPRPQPAAADTATLDRGRTLVMQGDPQQNVPACVSCHGVRMLGVAPAVFTAQSVFRPLRMSQAVEAQPPTGSTAAATYGFLAAADGIPSLTAWVVPSMTSGSMFRLLR